MDNVQNCDSYNPMTDDYSIAEFLHARIGGTYSNHCSKQQTGRLTCILYS
jgi:hypothetical protein